MYFKLTQNEILDIPNNILWFPIERSLNGDQIIWANSELNYETVSEDYQRMLNSCAITYLSSTDWYVTRQAETGKAIPEDILNKRQEAREAIDESI